MISVLALLVIAAICGGIAARLGGRGPVGCLASTAVGFVGALAGTWLSQRSGIPDPLTLHLGGRAFPVVWSIAGGALFAAVLTLLVGKKKD